MQRLHAGEFDRLLLEQRPLLDVRAPVEFRQGSIPGAVNLPLLEDEERHRVGIRYRQAGQEAAIALGHELVGGAVREQRIEAWSAFVDATRRRRCTASGAACARASPATGSPEADAAFRWSRAATRRCAGI